MKILGTGLSGLVGSRFVELFDSVYEFSHINLENGIDILNKKVLEKTVASSSAPIIIHMAAKTNVDKCELDRQKDKNALSSNDFTKIIKQKTAWAVNVLGTENIIKACQENNIKLIYVSTDFVFDGTKKSYTEEDKPDPINWYAKTKHEGEKLVQNSGLNYIIVRPAYPYRAFFERGDIVRSLIDKLSKGEKLKMVTDHIMRPTFIDDLANALDILIRTGQQGIFHVVGSQSLTPYELAIKIADEFSLDKSLISTTTRKEYFLNKAQRPFCLNLKNDKIGKLGIEMATVDKGLKEVKKQMEKINI